MPRPAAWRLSPDSYPKREEIQTRYQDLDPNGHLNNVAFAALFETVRVRMNHTIGDAQRGKDFRAVVARNEINYLAEGSFPAPVEIAIGIGKIGNRSWEMLAAMFQNGVAIATCDTVIVMTAPAGEPLPEAMREGLKALRVREG
ncbi:acyl-CoA thioesterase [Sphingomonas sp. MMSM20]|uniref:acyl-CoA thioesterase n=1 Tax=Sphingomonas lycopersici TaxID=2951807 RepID=UPI0022378FDE|nr:acyl-CoA thioesterase [Sphingomonas lycopersici]MCW6533107.1 acyl-CoA thioesterase [Sphingomonas lycopersici]